MATARPDVLPGLATPTLENAGGAARSSVPPSEVVQLVRTYGQTVSTALLDMTCSRFSVRSVDGAIAYRAAMGSVVAIGDPVCPADEAVTLARAFTAAARRKGLASVFAVTTE